MNQVQQKTQQKISPGRLVDGGAILGVILITGGVLWAGGLQGEDLLTEWFPEDALMQDIAIGAGIGILFSSVVWLMGFWLPGLQRIQEAMMERIEFESMRWWHVLSMSFWAAVPEEVFFRGAMQPALGFLVTAVIFALMHSMSPTYFIYALIAGLGLGYLVEWRGNLWMAIAAHFATDMVSLAIMAKLAIQRTEVAEYHLDTTQHPVIYPD